MGIVQRLHFGDHRLDDALARRQRLAMSRSRDRRTDALDDCEATVSFCFTPEFEGPAPHHSSLPRNIMYFADFRARMTGHSATAEPIRQTALA